ncbi:hypothetical protein [Nocardioides limicola]|uniref:hypothetical protein n=1 Tax=Nocardioides limicola TaxID=2803368 RepID=UPI00193B5F92|nr:hypothetical protein [Nocardioides sp. DJM-14]
MRKLWVGLVVAAVVSLAGCSSGQSEDPTPTPSPAPDDQPAQVSLVDGVVDPPALRLRVGVGEPVRVEFTADHAGELHVHSRPEDIYLAYDEGTTLLEFIVEVPGVVEVESHDNDRLLVFKVEAR